MKNETQITICGDICPTKDTVHLFKTTNINGLFNSILPILKQSAMVVGNLEFPLANTCKGIKKAGPVLKGNPNYIQVFKEAGFNVLGLANNHIKDCGTNGVKQSLKICKENTIETVGAGSNIVEAKKPLIKEVNGWKIGIMAFAEHEFNLATEKEAGANNFDVYEDLDTIKELKKTVDYVIILYHGGIEYYEYPSPLLQKKCRKMIEAGANLVTCQHSHCIGTTENFKKGTIVYGQGNTVFGYKENNKSWNEGLLLKILLNKNSESKLEYIPVKATKMGIELMEEKETVERLTAFFNKSKRILDKNFVLNSWNSFCENKKGLYMPWLFGFNRIFIHINRISGNRLIRIFYSKKRIRTSLNVMRCEAHNEVITTILEKHTN